MAYKKLAHLVTFLIILGLLINLVPIVAADDVSKSMPDTIRVYRTDTGNIEEVDFKEYVKNVLPNEWMASWDKEALKAGAISIKTYAWYWTLNEKYPGEGYDVKDSVSDQVYKPGSSNPTTDQAIEETWNWFMTKDGQIFQSQYIDGWPDKAEPTSYYYWSTHGQYKDYPGRLSQHGSQYLAKNGNDWRSILHYYYDPIGLGGADPNWPSEKANIRKNVWDGFIDFEDGTEGSTIKSTISGLKFTTTTGQDWIYGDWRTGNYNGKYPNGDYTSNGNLWAWLGPNQGFGRIDFPEGSATYLSLLTSTQSGVIMDAHDSNDNLVASSGWASSNTNDGKMTRLTVEAPDMAYVIVHDTGNYWVIDDIVTDAPGVPSAHYEAAELAKTLVGAPYLFGGKGWDYNVNKFAGPESIVETGYKYYNSAKKSTDFGDGIDCSGLILWAYNKAYGSAGFLGKGNPVRSEGADGQHRNNFQTEITEDQLEPGDVLFFDAWQNHAYTIPGQDGYYDHVAMYVGPFTYENVEYDVVESRGGEGVEFTTVDDIINRIEDWAGEDAFVGYHRLVEPKVDMDVSSYSPVDIIITDPDGIIITKEIYEVPGIFYYSEWDIDEDGDLDDRIILPERKNGNYRIEVIAEPGADPTETYTLEVSIGDSTLVLAKDIPISEIPNLPYMIESTETGIIINPVNDPPLASVDIAEQTVQYSDGISPVTISASDIDSSLTLTTSWKMNDGAEQTGLPDDLTLSSGSCTTTGPSTACTWTLGGKASVTAGNYNITFNVGDGQYEIIKHTNLIVRYEDSMIAFDDINPVAVKVAAPGGKSEAFSLKVNVKEAIADISDALAPLSGDTNLAEVSVSLVPVGPGSSVNPASCSRTVAGTGYDATLALDCGFNNVDVNTYEVMVSVNGGYYIGSGENVLVVYDPSLGFTTGGGTFLWPETGEKTNFGYAMKYNKKGKKVQGSLLLVRHLPDGTIYRVKSNALYGLSIGEDDTYGWASFSGKATYLKPEWLEPVGNHEFIVYVEDRDEPENGADHFWIKVKGQDGAPIDAMSLNYPSIDNTISLNGGNIVVPHK